jgi:DNA-binding response OmpR family regulator
MDDLLTIMVVDDQPMLRLLIARALALEGYRVLEAGNGDEAIALAAKYGDAINLMLTDVQMPGMDGFEAARRVRQRCPGMRTLFMTGHPDSRERAEAEGLDLVTKPFSPSELLARIGAALASRNGHAA